MKENIFNENKEMANRSTDDLADFSIDVIRLLPTINKGDYKVDWNTYFRMIKEISDFTYDYQQKNMCIDSKEIIVATIDHFKDSLEHQKILHFLV